MSDGDVGCERRKQGVVVVQASCQENVYVDRINLKRPKRYCEMKMGSGDDCWDMPRKQGVGVIACYEDTCCLIYSGH